VNPVEKAQFGPNCIARAIPIKNMVEKIYHFRGAAENFCRGLEIDSLCRGR